MFVESGCISAFEGSIFCLSADINFKLLAFSSVVMIYSFKSGIVKDTGQNSCHFKHAVSRKYDAVKFDSLLLNK